MQKNIAGQKIAFVVYDATTGLPKTGDAANLTAYVSKDAGAVNSLADVTATELDAVNAKGCYAFDVAQAESNADMLVFTCKSATANIFADPILLFTEPPAFNTSAAQTGDSFQRIGAPAGASAMADLASVKVDTGTTIPGRLPAALAADGSIKATVQGFLGTAFTEGALGRFAANFKTFFNVGAATGTQDHGILVDAVTNTTNAPTAGDLTAAMKASVKAQAVAALSTDTYPEPGQGAPAATDSLATKINFLYKAWRNKKTQNGTTQSLFSDDTVTVDQKSTVSDDGTTATVGEVGTGP